MMRYFFRPTTCVDVAYRLAGAAALVIGGLGCAERKALPFYDLEPNGPQTAMAACDVPNTGCACDTPGTLVDCGELRARTDDYLTCMQGVRRCGDNHAWGACAGDLVQVAVPGDGTTRTAALGRAESCNPKNVCDPLCRQILDTGDGALMLPEGLCSSAGGIGLCPLCGYAGPTSQLPYAEMPVEWQQVPATCSTTADKCTFDMACAGGACQSRAQPCASPNLACLADLTLGKPCIDFTDPNNTYHIPLCNRGARPLTTGTVRIGVDSRSANVAACAPVTGSVDTAGFPNRGYVEVQLSAAQTIEAGGCIDVTSTNSVAVELDLTGSRALVANYDGGLEECNSCNNGSAVIVQGSDTISSTCSSCIGPGCADLSTVRATLSGVLYDPAGRNPVPNALVYVPTTAVAALVDGVACDTCANIVSGHPLVWAKTDAWGRFALAGVPSERTFSLVAQSGRWRRQLTVGAIPSGATRWVASVGNGDAQVTLTDDDVEPVPATDRLRRLRLPATQRRCDAAVCTGEGDIPRLALLMGGADPLQCALRRIGIADAEFTGQAGDGRVQIFTTNGMQVVGGTPGFGTNGLLSGNNASGASRLFDYSMLIAPCNGEHDDVAGSAYAMSPYASGPSYNSWPDPTANAIERANVKSFVDAGGRLMATHWLSMDLVHLNYFPPARANFSVTSGSVPLQSPYESRFDSGFTSAKAAYAASVAPGFVWSYQFSSEYNPLAPAQYLFGNNVNAGGNLPDAPSGVLAGGYPRLLYSVDTSTELGRTFSNWAGGVGATWADVDDQVPWQSWSPLVRRVRTNRGVTRFLSGNSTSAWRFYPDPNASRAIPVDQEPCLQGDLSAYDCSHGRTWGTGHVGMFQLDAPMDAVQQCGRAAVIAGHASQNACFSPSNTRATKYCGNVPPYSNSNPPPDCDCLTFPSDAISACGDSTELTPEELSFEFLLFSAGQCFGEPPTLTDLPSLTTSVFIRDFVSDCADNEQTVWQLFSWQALVPEGARIEFYGATADTPAELAGADSVKIGVADERTNTWTAANHTVAEFFRLAEPPQLSKKWLRVKMRFVPNATATPTLTQWRAVFNCTDNE